MAGVNIVKNFSLSPSRIIDPIGNVLAQTDEDISYAMAEIDLNKRMYSYWLSVGPHLEKEGIYT